MGADLTFLLPGASERVCEEAFRHELQGGGGGAGEGGSGFELPWLWLWRQRFRV
jgi:hypothetical protein